MFTEDQLGAELLLLPNLRTECPERLELTKLFWRAPAEYQKDDISDLWVTAGVDASVEPVKIEVGLLAEAPAQAADLEFDFSVDLNREARREKKRRRGQPVIRHEMVALAAEIDDLQVAMADLMDADIHGSDLLRLQREEEEEQDADLEDDGGQCRAGSSSVGPEAPAAALAAAAMPEEEQADDQEVGEEALAEEFDDYQGFLDSLSISVAASVVRDRHSDQVVGRLHRVRNSIKATCYIPGHNRRSPCVCWIRVPDGDGMDRQVEKDLLAWFDQGNRGAGEDAHWRSSLILKRDKYHMKVK
jgi:hypothetical protein